MYYDRDCFEYLKTVEENMPAMVILSLFPSVVRMTEWESIKKYAPNARDMFGLGRIMG